MLSSSQLWNHACLVLFLYVIITRATALLNRFQKTSHLESSFAIIKESFISSSFGDHFAVFSTVSSFRHWFINFDHMPRRSSNLFFPSASFRVSTHVSPWTSRNKRLFTLLRYSNEIWDITNGSLKLPAILVNVLNLFNGVWSTWSERLTLKQRVFNERILWNQNRVRFKLFSLIRYELPINIEI